MRLFPTLKRITSSLFLAGWAGFVSPVIAQEISLKSGESVDLHAVYWIANCRSLLKDFAGIDILEGPPEITLSLREEPVRAERQRCADNIPGATVVATAREVTQKTDGTLKFRVRYNTEVGQRQSNHTYRIFLYPPR